MGIFWELFNSNNQYRVILQGVHEHFSVTEHTDWEDQPRVTKIVFIGKNLDRELIKEEVNNATNVKHDIQGNAMDVPYRVLKFRNSPSWK